MAKGVQIVVAEWLFLELFATSVILLFIFCDEEHFIPIWSLRLLFLAVALQSAGHLFGFVYLTMAAQIVSLGGLFWVLIGLIQDLRFHRNNHH